MEDNNLINKIVENLKNDLQLCKQMLEILHTEKESLSTHNIDQLESSVNEKTTLILKLDESQNYRNDLQLQLGLSAGYVGFTQLLAKEELKSDPKINTILKELKSTLEEIRNLNSINGKIVNLSMSQNQRVIDLLYGKESLYYGADAQAVSSCNKSRISEA